MVVFVFFYKQSKSFKYKIDKILLYIPFAGKIIHLSELARFAYMNAILIKSGVVVTKAFKLSSNILKNEVLKSIFLDATKRVVEGEKLSKYLQNNTGFKIDTPFVQAIAIGEETSNLSEVLNNLALLYQENNQNKINRFLTLLEPMMMLIVGGMIGFIVVAMLLPIFSMSIQ
jgi:general secretion pathway protein F/type IV pilus assembly protein PilC